MEIAQGGQAALCKALNNTENQSPVMVPVCANKRVHMKALENRTLVMQKGITHGTETVFSFAGIPTSHGFNFNTRQITARKTKQDYVLNRLLMHRDVVVLPSNTEN